MKILNEIPPKADQDEMVAMDIEMFGQKKGKLHRPVGTFACLSICMEREPKNVYQIYDSDQIKAVLRQSRHATWVFHNALYDLRQMERFCPPLKSLKDVFVWDTMIVEQTMNGGYFQHFSLRDLARRWLNTYMEKEARDDFETATEMSNKMKTYAARDALVTLRIAMLQREKYSDEVAFGAYKKIDEPCIWPVLDMPGMRVNVDGWQKMVMEFGEQSRAIEDELGINTYSGAQVAKLAATKGIFLKNNQATTLDAFKNVPLIEKIIEAKKLRKAVSTYGKNWIEDNVESDGKVYASYHINGTETFRFSCSNPNMQQIPQRRMPIYRTMFIPSPGNTMSVWDVRQQEPCILAYETKDEELLNAIKSGEDLHLMVARAIFNEPKMKKDDPRRFIGKTINLGTSYGLSEFGLARRLNITEQEAANFLRLYFNRFKGVLLWTGQQRQFANQHGYVKTAAWHKIYINPYDDQHENNAINAPIQGGAADFQKVWMRKYWEKCRDSGLTYGLCASIHDEGVRDIPKEELKENDAIYAEAFKETAEQLYKGVPFNYDASHGRSWACKSISSEVDSSDE